MLATFYSKANPIFKSYELPLTAILASIISSYIALSYHQPFNVDGIIYLNAASGFIQGGLHQALDIYRWPFYSILIALMSKITHLHLESAAFLLNCILNTVTFLAFISLVKELGGSHRVQYLGLLIILIYPYLNHDRDNILRDFGYYSFALLSLLFYIRYLRLLTWRTALAYGTSILLATLFRIEGLVFLLIAPWIIFFRPHLTIKKKLQGFAQLNTLNFICASVMLVWLFKKIWQHSLFNSTHLLTLKQYLLQYNVIVLQENLHQKMNLLQQVIFTNGGFSSVPFFLIAGTIGIFLDSFINTIGLLYLILSWHAFRYHLVPMDKYAALGWSTYLILNLLIIIIFIFSQFFLAERYVELFCLLLTLGVPFSLVTIYDNWRHQKPGLTGRKWLFPVVCIFLGISAIDSMSHFGTSKAYITQAGRWIDQNTPANSHILSNSAQLYFYSHRFDPNGLQPLPQSDDPLINIKTNDLTHYDYVALVLYNDKADEEQEILSLLKSNPLATFQNRRGDKTVIFKIK